MLNNEEIKNKAWKEISQFNDSNDDGFDASAISFKIGDNYNLVVWCDIDYEFNKAERYYIVSIRYNPEDDSFGDDTKAGCSTQGITKEDLENAIDYVLNHQDIAT